MLNARLLTPMSLSAAVGTLAPAAAQDFAPHRAVYAVSALDRGKPGTGTSGTYAYELRLTCDGYVVSRRLRLETAGTRAAASEQQSQMSESRDGKKLTFEHRITTGGRQCGSSHQQGHGRQKRLTDTGIQHRGLGRAWI